MSPTSLANSKFPAIKESAYAGSCKKQLRTPSQKPKDTWDERSAMRSGFEVFRARRSRRGEGEFFEALREKRECVKQCASDYKKTETSFLSFYTFSAIFILLNRLRTAQLRISQALKGG